MLSLPKLLLVIAIVGAVFAISRLLRTKRTDNAPAPRPDAKPPAAADDAVDLDKCSVCGLYVAADSPPCERSDCPRTA